MQQAGMQVFTAGSTEGVNVLLQKQLAGKSIDLLVLDETLPDISTAPLVEHLRQQNGLQQAPILLMGIGSRKEDATHARAQGCNAYLGKPAPAERLLEMLANLLTAPSENTLSVHDLASARASRKQGAHTAYPDFEGARILLVEDSQFNRSYALEVLQKMNCLADYAINGLEAVAKVEQAPYDLILMDCQMPEMDGFEASRHIQDLKEMGKLGDIPVIALTANALAEDKQRCFDAGMQDYLTKPMRVNDLKTVLQKWLPAAQESNSSTA